MLVSPFSITDTYRSIERGVDVAARPRNRSRSSVGGDHSVTLPLLRAMHAKHGQLALVHFDAHCDVSDTQFGSPYHYGSVFRRAVEEKLIHGDKTCPDRHPQALPQGRDRIRPRARLRAHHRRANLRKWAPTCRTQAGGAARAAQGPQGLRDLRHRFRRRRVRAGRGQPGAFRPQQLRGGRGAARRARRSPPTSSASIWSKCRRSMTSPISPPTSAPSCCSRWRRSCRRPANADRCDGHSDQLQGPRHGSAPHHRAEDTATRRFSFRRLADDLDQLDAHFAFLGLPFGSPYTIEEVTNDQTRAPTAVRQASDRVSRNLERWDFDVGGPIFDGRDIKLVDCGDVPGDARDLGGHYVRAEQAVRKILTANAHSAVHRRRSRRADPGAARVRRPRPHHAGAHRRAPRLARRGQRRAGRLFEPHPARLRNGRTSARSSRSASGRRAARGRKRSRRRSRMARNIITAYELHDVGMDAILERIPDGGQYYLTIDADGMDPSVMPAVAGAGARRRHVPPGAQADPRPRAQGTRGRHGRRRDHAQHRRQPHLQHHRRPPVREPDRRRGSRRLFRRRVPKASPVRAGARPIPPTSECRSAHRAQRIIT